MDFTQAHRYICLAADQGDIHALGVLGFMYALGICVTKDKQEANRLFSLLASKQHGPSPSFFKTMQLYVGSDK